MSASEKAPIKSLEEELERIQQGQVFEYLSRWSFERLLDRLASCVRDTLSAHFPVQWGCSILYRAATDKMRYVLGGSSTRRTTMDPLARYYYLRDGATKSFTARSLWHATPLVFDDFRRVSDHAARRGRSGVVHANKACELGPSATQSYLTIPRLDRAELVRELARATSRSDKLPRSRLVSSANLPTCLFRVTWAGKGYAKRAAELFSLHEGAALLKLFDIVERGRRSFVQRERGAIDIADLNANLLRYISSEYEGLDELAFHLQTLFGECECSIFLAHIQGKEARLHLAATTALSPSAQHTTFRRAFFDQRAAYVCPLDLDLSHHERIDKLAKTVQAYCHPDTPVYHPDSQGSGHFPGKGEYAKSRSFLAVAIPSRQSNKYPYGVIRLVRGDKVQFTKKDEHLAVAIAKNLNYWLEFFPRNDALSVTWSSPGLRVDTLRTLFAIEDDLPRNPQESEQERERRLGEAEIEFEGFLRKVFVKSTAITVKKHFGGYSGATVLLVENDSGLDLILKCARKRPNESKNVIIQEIENYREFVEGKLALNHNVIYPELIREMRSINGFATTFLGSSRRERMTLKDFVSSKAPAAAVFAAVRAIVSKIVDEVWQWWYRPQHREPKRGTIDEFVCKGLHGDEEWHTTEKGLMSLDSSVVYASRRLRRKVPDELPSTLWKKFKEWALQAAPIEWEKGVTHGDLHGGNIFFEPDSMEVWVIDFARTGKYASIADLAALEVNIKLQLLPLLLRHQGLVEDQIDFLQRFEQIERTLAGQLSYDVLTLPNTLSTRPSANEKALDALREAVRAVTQIRQLLHQSLGRRGSMTDYRIALYLLSHWYMGVRGASDHDNSSLQVLMAYTSVRELFDSLSGRRAEPVTSGSNPD